MNFIEIQTWPEVPQIAFFSSLFSRSFNLPEFDIEDLEEALLLDSSENNTLADNTPTEFANPRLITDLIVSLLKGCDLLARSWPNITASNYQMFLRRILRHKCEEHNIENPFNTDVDFHSLPLRTKVVILNCLCEFRLDSSDVDVKTSKLEADSLRIQPLGYDSNDSTYWYFYGTRLYREDIQKKASGSEHIWQVICFTEDDWHSLANKFKSSKSRKEQSLHKCLVEDFLPSIPYLFKVREAERRRRLFQRRSSVRVKSFLEQQKSKAPVVENDEVSTHSGDEPQFIRISFSEKFLKEKKREEANREKVREKIQQDRALRAQRRRSSHESTSSGKSSNDNNVLNSKSDELSLITSTSSTSSNNQNNSRSNKENIFTRLNSHNAFIHSPADKEKMPPVTTKLPGRQTNNSLSSMTGNILIEATAAPQAAPSPVPTTSSRKKKAKAESYLETDEVLQIGMHKVLQYVKNHDDAWPFMDPVEEEIAPRYYSIIKRPMDLLKMEEKLENGEYLSYTDFRTDFKLIVNNCRLYNGQNNEYTQMVNNLQIAFDRATKKYFDQSSSDEEQVLLEYPPVAEINNKTKRKVPNSEESISKSEDVKHSKYSKKETTSKETNSVNERKSATKKDDNKTVNKKQNKSTLNKLESSAKNTKRKKEKEKEKETKKDKNQSKKIVENTDDSDIEQEVKIESKTKNANKTKSNKKSASAVLPIKEVKMSKKYASKKKLKEKGKEKEEKVEKKLPKSYNKKVKNNKKVGGKKSSSTEMDIIKNEDAFKDDSVAYNTDFSSNESIRDLINESFTKPSHTKKEKHGKKEKAVKDGIKKGVEKSSKQIKKNKQKISASKLALGCLDDDFNMLLGNSRDKEKSPALLSIDSNDTNSFSDLNKSSTSFEIKDKFDLIKERRNQEKNQEKNLLKEKNNINKAAKKSSKTKSLETIGKHEKHHDKEKKDKPNKEKKSKKEAKSLFDELLEDRNNDIKVKEKKPNKEEKTKLFSQELSSSTSNEGNSSKKKASKQKATLDVLDLETEQTLKDINKWLEHTPRFEYNSESNSPSRYTIEDMDVHLKSDNNDFRKPIPLMPSSPPSTSKKLLNSASAAFQSVQKNIDSVSKDIDNSINNNRDKETANLAHQKKIAKLSKKKLLGDGKHSIVMNKKREIQRTTNRLQPGKTKGNLLSNLQSAIKPDEYIPLGNKEKVKEIKNALTTETDENSPKLNLGKVLDPSTFNFSNKGLEKEEPTEHKINDRISDDDNESIEKEQKTKKDAPDDEQSENSFKMEAECSNTNVTAAMSTTSTNAPETNAKPNLSAWFKAFGVAKKPSNSETDSLKKAESNKNDSFIPQRRLSTGSSVSEISSVESSPHISMEDRSAPAPFPSPIAASPISAISPKLDDIHKASYPDNGPMRVGFYQDTTSTKSSPEKSCSPQEQPLSSPYQQYSQQSNVYSSQSANVYSNFYNPESTASNKQHHSSSNSPLYYDQYKSHFNQESNLHKTMNASVSPSSSHHSQQSSPYQQQPNSPYTPDNMSSEIHSTNSSGSNNNNNNNNATSSNNNNMSNVQSPSSTYSQSNSPYHQHPASPYHSQQTLSTTNPNFNNQITPNQNSMFEQQQQQEVSQFSPNPQQPHSNASQKSISNNAFSATDIRQPAPSQHNPLNSMQHPSFTHSSKTNEATMSVSTPIVQQQHLYPGESPFMANETMRSKKIDTPSEGMFGGSTASEAPQQQPYQEESRRQASSKVLDERQENPKYLDLSKQTNRFSNQYQVPSNFPQPLDLDFSKNRAYDATRNVQKGNNYQSSLPNCQLPNDSTANTSTQQKIPIQHDIAKETPKPSISNFIQNSASLSGNTDLMSSHQTAARTAQPPAIDMNYKQNPLFNSSSASSMMELTAFMRDFRQAEDRFASMSNASTNYYDKTNPAHMFASKNAPQSSSTPTNFQQIYSNPMTTIAYGREQQDFSNYQSRLNIFQSSNNANQMMTANQQTAVSTPPIEAKTSKKQKKKKTAEVVPPQTPTSTLSQHQLPGTNQQQAHQQYVHQQPFQSFPGIKVPPSSSTDSSSLSIKSVVPGSAFNYGPPSIPGLYGENSAYLEEFRGTQNAYYSQALRSAESIDKTVSNQPPQAHPTTPSSPYHHLLPSHHPSRSYPFMNSIDPAALQQQYRMMFNQSYQAGYHLGMHQQPPHWHM